jgi:hypothetical protein
MRFPAHRALAAILVVLPSVSALAADRPAPLRVTSIEWKEGARINNDIAQECDLEQVVTRSFRLAKVKSGANKMRTRKSDQPATEVVLRIDRVARLTARPPPRPAPPGVELGMTLLAVGGQPVDQPFLCRESSIARGETDRPQCVRLERCGKKLADQVATWLIMTQ